MMNKDTSDLTTRKNLGTASINILHAVGINNYDDLKTVGSVEAYVRIKKRNIHVSRVMLYALEGALMDVHWNTLAPELKETLLNQVADAEAASA